MKPTAESYDVVVMGAGAAGLFCAFTAAARGRKVLVLEKTKRPGKKILMSGGGRCNFTNRIVEPENYLSKNPHFCKSALSRYTPDNFIELVERHSIEFEERKHGQLFCLHSAKDILNMLLQECRTHGVRIECRCEVEEMQFRRGSTRGDSASDGSASAGSASNSGPVAASAKLAPSPDRATDFWNLSFSREGLLHSVECESIVIATGALSIPTMGGSGMGYEVAERFGMKVVERRAGLVPFMFSGATKQICERLTGNALDVDVSCRGESFRENMLFTHRGMSGPVILQMSNYWFPGDEVSIDLLPNLRATEWLLEAKTNQPRLKLKSILSQQLVKSLVHELEGLWWPEDAERSLAELSAKKLTAVGENLNAWRVKPSATEGYRTAEVTLGGVDTSGIHSKTMEAKCQPGLYFVGEVMDVTGHLGGFNFQWAWASGHAAGTYV